MTKVSTAVKKVADSDTWIESLYVAGGFFGPTVVENVVEGEIEQIPEKVPSEAYGLGAMAAEYKFLTGKQRSRAMAGSGLFVLDSLADRTGLKQSLENPLGNGGAN
jgi:hypothetical protein